jgi:hypothetical protein
LMLQSKYALVRLLSEVQHDEWFHGHLAGIALNSLQGGALRARPEARRFCRVTPPPAI